MFMRQEDLDNIIETIDRLVDRLTSYAPMNGQLVRDIVEAQNCIEFLQSEGSYREGIFSPDYAAMLEDEEIAEPTKLKG